MRLVFRQVFVQIRSFSTEETRTKCLSLMRSTAQPVSVITTAVPPDREKSSSVQHAMFHGATLSSFTSIAMYPYPIVSFSLRTPSYMADVLRHYLNKATSSEAHMVINLLSALQAHLAVHFSQPRDDPFGSALHSLSAERLPILHGCLGALSCTLIKSIPLHVSALQNHGSDTSSSTNDGVQSSELFLARVVRVEDTSHSRQASEVSMLPLIYHQKQYVTIDTTSPVENSASHTRDTTRTTVV
ncbi:flavin reductase like domain-containing protein [Hysterangium stoloniferum]|nr:flavin reductase like domain-containing protein [Hysterangium stoloniferum]